MADLSEEKGQEPFPQWAFIGFNLHRIWGMHTHTHTQLINHCQAEMIK